MNQGLQFQKLISDLRSLGVDIDQARGGDWHRLLSESQGRYSRVWLSQRARSLVKELTYTAQRDWIDEQ